MSNVKHTPGPWAVWTEHPVVFAVTPDTINTDGSISGYRKEICRSENLDGDVEDDCGEEKANMFLIAAAPDMLAACKGVVECFKTALFAGYEPSGLFASHAEIDAHIAADKRVIALEVAIARAEGQTV